MYITLATCLIWVRFLYFKMFWFFCFCWPVCLPSNFSCYLYWIQAFLAWKYFYIMLCSFLNMFFFFCGGIKFNRWDEARFVLEPVFYEKNLREKVMGPEGWEEECSLLLTASATLSFHRALREFAVHWGASPSFLLGGKCCWHKDFLPPHRRMCY